jgi:hypothetical protein
MTDPSQFSIDDINAEIARRQSTAPMNGQDFSANPNYQALAPTIAQTEQKYGLPAGLLANTAGAESSFNPSAVNPDSGATGLMQFMPSTAKQMGIDPTDPYQSIDAAGRYYQHLISQHNGDVPAAVAAYGGFVTKDPSAYQAKVIPQGYYAQNQQPTTTNPQQVQSDASPYSIDDINAEIARREANPDMGEVMKGVHRSIADTANLMENALPAFGKSAANELFGTSFDNKQDMIDYANKSADIQKQYGAQVGSIHDIKGPGDVIPYLKGQVGENLAGVIPIAGEGYLGSKIASKVLADTAEEAASKYMAEGMTQDLATQKAQNEIAAKGAALAVTGAMAPQQIAGEYASLMQQGHDDPMGAALIGGLETGVYMLPEMSMWNSIFGNKKTAAEATTHSILDKLLPVTDQSGMMKLAAREALTQGAKMGAAGMGAESIGVLGEAILGSNPDVFSAQNFSRIVDSGLNNAIGGGMFGAVAGAVHAPTPEPSLEKIGQKLGWNQEEGKPSDLTQPQPLSQGNLFTEKEAPKVESPSLDPSLLYPQDMPEDYISRFKRAGITVEDMTKVLHGLTDPEDRMRVYTDMANQLATSHPELFGLPKANPDALKGQAQARGYIPTKDGLGPMVRAQTPEMLANRPSWLIHPSSLFTTHDVAKARDVINNYVQGLDNPDAIMSFQEKNLTDAGRKRLIKALNGKMPDTLTPTLIKEAKANGIPITETTTPQDIIHGLSVKNLSENLEPKFDNTEFQHRVENIPTYGTVSNDILQPKRVNDALSKIPMGDEQKKFLSKSIDQIKRIVGEVTGNRTQFHAVEKLIDNIHHDPVLGAQLLNHIYVSFGNGYTEADRIEAGYHEGAHFLWKFAMTPEMKQIVHENAAKLKDYFQQDGFLKDQNFDAYLGSKRGLEELWANAAGKEGYKRFSQDPTAMKGIPFVLRQSIKQVLDFMDKSRNMMRGLGFQSFDSIMKSALDGKLAKDHINDAMHQIQYARAQAIATDFHKKYAKDHEDACNTIYDDNAKVRLGVKDENGKFQTNPQKMGWMGMWIESFRNLCDRKSFLAPVKNLYDNASLKRGQYLQAFAKSLQGGFADLNKADRAQCCDIMKAVNKSQKLLRFNQDGTKVSFDYHKDHMQDVAVNHGSLKEGQEISVTNPGLVKGLKALQDAGRMALGAKETEWRKSIAQELGVKPDFGKQDLADETAKLNDKYATPEARNSDDFKAAANRLQTVGEELDALAKLKSSEYMPSVRYGKYAYSVHYRNNDPQGRWAKGDLKALITVESGTFNKAFDPRSMERAKSELAKYSGSDFVIHDSMDGQLHDKNGVQKRDIGLPFALTHDNMRLHGINLDNLETMMGVLNSRDVDPDKYNDIRDMLSSKMSSDEFSKMFKKSRNIDGYSRDWDRVLHSWMTTDAHYMSHMDIARKLPYFRRQYAQLLDANLKTKIAQHIGGMDGNGTEQRGYLNSAGGDYSMLRMANYLWCMGGNMSSLLVETMKLPTATLGNLNQINPNPLNNMAMIGKYMAKSLKYTKELNYKFGAVHSEDIINKMLANKDIDQDEAKAIKIALDTNRLAESNTRTYATGDTYGTETAQGQFANKASQAALWLSKPLAMVERMIRTTSFMANFNTMRAKETQVPGFLDKLYQTNEIYKDMRQRNPDWSPALCAALYACDEENGTPGKVDRSPYLQGAGGAILIPFMSFDHNVLESMVKMYNRGTDGRRALGVMLGAFALFSGVQGLPGMKLLLNTSQAAYNSINGTDYDWEYLIKKQIADDTGSAKAGVLVTNGALRAFGNIEISERIGLPIPGEDVLMNLMGQQGHSLDTLGVEGNMINNAASAWNAYRNGQPGFASIAQAIMPTAASNMEKAYLLSTRGAMSGMGGVAPYRALPPDQVSTWSVMARALGLTSDQIASANEQIHETKMQSKETQTADARFQQRMAYAQMTAMDAAKNGDSQGVQAAQEDLKQAAMEYAKFCQDNHLPLDMASKMNELRQQMVQREEPLAPTRANLGGKQGLYRGTFGVNQFWQQYNQEQGR